MMSGESSGPPRHPSTSPDWDRVVQTWAPAAPISRPEQTHRARTVTVQFWSAYAALFVIEVFVLRSFGAGSTYDGATTLIAAPVVLIFSLAFPAVTLLAVAVPGLAIRLIPKLRSWWISHSYLAAGGALTGLALLGVAYLAGFTETGVTDGTRYSVRVPDQHLLATGWFVLAFFALHVWLPLRWGRIAD